MCVALIGFRAHPVAPLVVAANRDEFYHRPAALPSRISENPWILAGLDLEKGGTWLGMTRWGVVGLTNEPSGGLPSREKRSRGLLVMDALHEPCADAALSLAEKEAARHAPFHLFALDMGGGGVVNWDGARVTVDPIREGWHVLPNAPLDASDDFKVIHAQALLRETVPRAETPEALVRDLIDVLSSHAGPTKPPSRPEGYPASLRLELARLCVHTPTYGTRSSSVLMMGGRAGRRYWHLEGSPCRGVLTKVDVT